MSTSSIFHNIVIDSIDKAEKFVNVLEKAEEWHNAHTKIKPKIKSRSKYQRGEQIKTIVELIDCKFIYFHHKVYHEGWWKSWQFRNVEQLLRQGKLYKAERIGGDIPECK